MPTVRVEPAGHVLAATPHTTIMAAAHAAGYYWPTICGGEGTCRTCVARVLAGSAGLSPVSAWEQEGLDAAGLTERPGDEALRLACQARVGETDVVVHKPGVRPV